MTSYTCTLPRYRYSQLFADPSEDLNLSQNPSQLPKYEDVNYQTSVKSDALRLTQERTELLADYLNPDETIVGFGVGGSESMTLFLEKPGREKFVRKILSERLITAQWNRQGHDVMLPPYAKAKRQTEYLLKLPESVKHLFPQVYNVVERQQEVLEQGETKTYNEFIYDMTFIPGIEVSEFVRVDQPSKEIVAALYGILFRLLNQTVHRECRRTPEYYSLESSYFSKIEQRLALSQQTAPETFSDQLLKAEEIVINGQKFHNIPYLLRKFRKKQFQNLLEPFFHSLVMGDTNTENIKIGNIEPLLRNYKSFSVSYPPFTAEDLQIRFLDPRAIGFHENGQDTGADDPMYDNKPWHNSMGNYDKIHGEFFDVNSEIFEGIPHLEINFHDHNPYTHSYDGIEQYFAQVMISAWDLDDPTSDINRNDPYWIIRFVFMMGTHFAAMPPFHFSKNQEGVLIDDAQHQKRPLAIYAEGIKWLNIALDMLEGKVKDFHGISVPVVAPAVVSTYSQYFYAQVA